MTEFNTGLNLMTTKQINIGEAFSKDIYGEIITIGSSPGDVI